MSTLVKFESHEKVDRFEIIIGFIIGPIADRDAGER